MARKETASRPKILLVDGYNVLRSGSRYQEAFAHPDYTDDAFNTARERLINDVINFAGPRIQGRHRVRRRRQPVLHRRGGDYRGVRIMFSPAGTSADKVIEKLAHDARVRNVETVVVTSDATIQDTVFGGGIDRMSANGFSREVGMYYEDVHLDETPKVALKRTLGDRIKPDVLEKLKAMRDDA